MLLQVLVTHGGNLDGTLAGWPTWLETFSYLFLAIFGGRGKGIFLTMAMCVGIGSAIMTHGLWQTYQRNLKGVRCLFRFTVVVLCLLLVIIDTMSLWVDGICMSAMRHVMKHEAVECSQPAPTGQLCPGLNITCGLPVGAITRPTGCAHRVVKRSSPAAATRARSFPNASPVRMASQAVL